MRSSTSIVALAASIVAAVNAQSAGFNYGSTFTDGSAKQQSDFEAEFNRAKSLQNTTCFSSARLYTMIQAGTADTPISAIPAAIATQTTLLLGMWASAGEAVFSNELLAFQSAVSQYGSAFLDLIVGVSVGSEDLYRISPTGIENMSGVGAGPDVIADYIGQLRSAVQGTAASGISIGHVDTWTAWVNGSNDAVISAVDWIGTDAYPYFQTTMANGIENGNATFFSAYDDTVAAAQGKPVWVTETGWPVSGPLSGQAVASIPNAKTYWDEVACTLLGSVNTWWYTLQDAAPTTPSPSFGIVGSDLSSAPLYSLGCPAGTRGSGFCTPGGSSGGSGSSSSSSSSRSAGSTATSSVASPSAPSSTAIASTATIETAPGTESAPSTSAGGATATGSVVGSTPSSGSGGATATGSVGGPAPSSGSSGATATGSSGGSMGSFRPSSSATVIAPPYPTASGSGSGVAPSGTGAYGTGASTVSSTFPAYTGGAAKAIVGAGAGLLAVCGLAVAL